MATFRIDLLGHSAGGSLAVLYAIGHPDRVGRLALVDLSPRVVGVDVTDTDRRQVAELRGGHYPWHDDPEWLVRTLAEFLN